MFNHNLSLSFRNKTVYNEILVYLFENIYFCCTFSLKTKIQKILSILGSGYFQKTAKINSQQEKPLCKSLYTSSRTNANDPRFYVFFDSSTLPQLSPHQADSFEGLLTKEECYASLKSFSKGQSPGTDGLTAELYLSFWKLLWQELVDSFNYAFEKGEMPISQKRGIITLIPKKDKKRTLSDHWRPISLLNTDYKVATKSIAARIAKMQLPGFIHEDRRDISKAVLLVKTYR